MLKSRQLYLRTSIMGLFLHPAGGLCQHANHDAHVAADKVGTTLQDSCSS